MQKYINNVINQAGTPVVGASVTVLNYPAMTAATIYSDNGITVIPGNVVTTDTSGMFGFYAANGRYALQITGSGVTMNTVLDISLLDLIGLPTALPGSAGQIWNDGGDVAIS